MTVSVLRTTILRGLDLGVSQWKLPYNGCFFLNPLWEFLKRGAPGGGPAGVGKTMKAPIRDLRFRVP